MTLYRDTKNQRSKPGRAAEGLRGGKLAQGWQWSNVLELLRGYVLLALYIGITQLLGVGFFQVAAGSRALWIIGALLLLVVVTMTGQPQAAAQRSTRAR